MAVGSPPTVRRRQLGRELRKLREAAGLKAEQLAHELHCSASRISRIETARIRIAPGTVHEILDVLDIQGAERAQLVRLARVAQEAGWWQEYGDTITYEYSTLIALESEAAELRTFEPTVVPGLLQTEDYARAVTRKTVIDQRPEWTETRVEVRMARQQVLTRADPVRLWAVLDEGVLRRVVGGPAVMRAQLRALFDAGERANVRILVLPFARGAHACTTGPFVIIGFPEDADPDVVYVETKAGDLYVEKKIGIQRYNLVFDDLRADALGADESAALIGRIAEEMS